MAAGLPSEDINDINQGSAAEGEVSPLVRTLDKSANKTGNDHDPVDEDNKEESRPWHGGSQQKIHEKERGGDEPINVADIEDLTVPAGNDRLASNELDIDGSPAQVGSHGEVGNGGDHGDSCGDVVEDTVLARLGQAKADEDKGANGHNSTNCPVPIRTTDGNSNVDGLAVDNVG